jgi:hypothetical protein
MSIVAVDSHLEQAIDCIARGESSMREAAEHIDEARRLDNKLTQHAIAARIGKSVAWVNVLIRWKAEGYKSETPFGPQSKASRKKAAAFQATKQPPEKVTPERLLREKARAERDTANASAAEARAKAAEVGARSIPSPGPHGEVSDGAFRCSNKAEQAKQEAEAERLRASRPRAEGNANISYEDRDLLVKLLGKLGSEHEGERANAAKMADDLRNRLGLKWSDLIVPCRVENVEDRTDAA